MRKRNINNQMKIWIVKTLQRWIIMTLLREETLAKIKKYFTGNKSRINLLKFPLKKLTKVKTLQFINIRKQIFNIKNKKIMNKVQSQMMKFLSFHKIIKL